MTEDSDTRGPQVEETVPACSQVVNVVRFRTVPAYSSVLKGSESARTWGMSTAIAYIKSLGFDRVKGSSYTDASHGSKSKEFTYEEKYVWLAVHYLKGYLSDYLPFMKQRHSLLQEQKIISILSEFHLLNQIKKMELFATKQYALMDFIRNDHTRKR